jgi:hypothetical protein
MPTAFRLLDPFEVFLGDDNLPLAGGHFEFNEAGTSNPKDVFGDRDLTVDNGAEIELDSVGRTAHDVWGSGAYRVRLYNAAGVLQAEADWVEIPGGEGTVIPTLVDGAFLTNNGSILQWATIRQLPDPTGQDGKMVVADGDGYALAPVPEIPEPPEPNIVVDSVAKSFLAGTSDDPTKYCVQTGSASAPASGTRSTSVAVNFGETFGALWHVSVSITSTSVTPAGGLPSVATTGGNSAGFTATFYSGDEDNGGNADITSAVNFTWAAFGTREVA